MKKLLLLGLCAMAIGCVSAPKAIPAADLSPMGVVSIMAEDDIPWYGDSKKSGGLLGAVVDKAIDQGVCENVADLLPVAETALRNALGGKGVRLVDAAALSSSKAYADAKEDKLASVSGMIVPSGYRFVTSRDASFLKKMAADTGLRTGLYVTFSFQKQLLNGVGKNGNATACVTINVGVVDVGGKSVLQRSYYARAKDSFAVVAGIYDAKKLMACFPEAIAEACGQFSEAFAQ